MYCSFLCQKNIIDFASFTIIRLYVEIVPIVWYAQLVIVLFKIKKDKISKIKATHVNGRLLFDMFLCLITSEYDLSWGLYVRILIFPFFFNKNVILPWT